MAINRSTSHISDTEQILLNKSRDDLFNLLAVMNTVYNPATGAADRMAKTDAQYILYDANDALPDYIGINSDSDAVTSATDWLIYKFVYSGSNVTSVRRKVGSWDGRVALFA